MWYNKGMEKFKLSDFVDKKSIETVLSDLILRIKQRRKELKISQKELAKISGVTYSSIRRFEETGDISLASLLKIANGLDCLEDFEHLFSNKIIKNLKDL